MNDLKGIIEDCNKSDLVSDRVIKKVIEIIGQEEWQDLHDENNDICTTMGELIITLKVIAELEQENKVLAQNLEDTEIVNKALEKENERLTVSYETIKLHDEEEIGMLKSENAELKEHLKCLVVGMYHIAQHHPTMGAHTKIMQDLREAEQFLNEVEK